LRREELALLDVDSAARPRGLNYQVGLPGQERGNLENIGGLSGSRHLKRVVNIGEHGYAGFGSHPAEYAEGFLDSKPTVGAYRGAIRFVVRRLEDVRDAETVSYRANRVSHLKRVRFAFDEARPGNQEQSWAANFDASDFEGFDRNRHK
jgi:hypothetical protein